MKYPSLAWVKGKKLDSFTLVELLITIGVIAILSTVVLTSLGGVRSSASKARTLLEFRTMETALELYFANYGDYPGDVSRNVPPGIEEFLGPSDSDNWPDAPWPGSVYDWDVFNVGGDTAYQISVRFCPQGGPLDECQFPDEDWANGFSVNSSYYWCIDGPCKPHPNENSSYPGYCANCGE